MEEVIGGVKEVIKWVGISDRWVEEVIVLWKK